MGPEHGIWDEIPIARFKKLWEMEQNRAVVAYKAGAVKGGILLAEDTADWLAMRGTSAPEGVSLYQFTVLALDNYWQLNDPWAKFVEIGVRIEDLPGAELGEARIDALGPDGLPTAATIIIDRDAAGIGWFVDAN